MSRCGEQEERFDMRRTYDLPKAVDQNVPDKGKVDNILRRPEEGFQKKCRGGIPVVSFQNYFNVKCRVVVNRRSGLTCDHLPNVVDHGIRPRCSR